MLLLGLKLRTPTISSLFAVVGPMRRVIEEETILEIEEVVMETSEKQRWTFFAGSGPFVDDSGGGRCRAPECIARDSSAAAGDLGRLPAPRI